MSSATLNAMLTRRVREREREEAAKSELEILTMGRNNTTCNHPGTCNLYMALFLVEFVQVLLMQCPGSFFGISGSNPSVSKSNRDHVVIFRFFNTVVM